MNNTTATSATPTPRRRRFKRLLLFALLFWVIAALAVLQYHRSILDWMSLRGYTPPANVAALATADTMTPTARHMFYVNHPTIDSKTAFVKNCNFGSEQSIVIGCYHSNQAGIHLLDVSDPRLAGVEQVTAAHEMLHAAYDRLGLKERTRIDALLQAYYDTVTDARIKATIDQYRKTEPSDVVNEMHSIFGTEIATLTPQLETYYSQYFSNRATVTNYAAAYGNEFTSRQQHVATYDAQLTQIKAEIEANTSALSTEQAQLQSFRARLDNERSTNTSQYNQDVDQYNARVNAYNAKIATTRTLIERYNDLVDKRNAIALEEQQLARAISGDTVPAAQ
jgi:hypothetical protein